MRAQYTGTRMEVDLFSCSVVQTPQVLVPTTLSLRLVQLLGLTDRLQRGFGQLARDEVMNEWIPACAGTGPKGRVIRQSYM